jgi:hypothetical protein
VSKWEVEVTDEFIDWADGLLDAQFESVAEAIVALEAEGPGLGRPFVDTIKASRHTNMKELRPRRGHLRILFAFDPRRTAILLLGGDKTGRWQEWYREAIPAADSLYDEHIALLKKENL